MKKSPVYFLSLIFLILSSCSNSTQRNDKFLAKLLHKNMPEFKKLLHHPEKFRLQILYTRIDRDSLNKPHFRTFAYHLLSQEYFYPASTVKLPVAILALEKINLLNIAGLTKYTSLRIDSVYSGQTPEYTDSTAANYLPSIAQYVKKIFLVSDNDAFNRLYEFLGQQYINQTLWAKGFTDVRIIRRLESGCSILENRATNPITFFKNNRIIYYQPGQMNPESLQVRMKGVKQGIGYYRNGELIKRPIDFSYSNYLSVPDLQNILKAVIFPGASDLGKIFDLNEEVSLYLHVHAPTAKWNNSLPGYH
jgi:hypothetical protein